MTSVLRFFFACHFVVFFFAMPSRLSFSPRIMYAYPGFHKSPLRCSAACSPGCYFQPCSVSCGPRLATCPLLVIPRSPFRMFTSQLMDLHVSLLCALNRAHTPRIPLSTRMFTIACFPSRSLWYIFRSPPSMFGFYYSFVTRYVV